MTNRLKEKMMLIALYNLGHNEWPGPSLVEALEADGYMVEWRDEYHLSCYGGKMARWVHRNSKEALRYR